jgi:hypothetical protein
MAALILDGGWRLCVRVHCPDLVEGDLVLLLISRCVQQKIRFPGDIISVDLILFGELMTLSALVH